MQRGPCFSGRSQNLTRRNTSNTRRCAWSECLVPRDPRLFSSTTQPARNPLEMATEWCQQTFRTANPQIWPNACEGVYQKAPPRSEPRLNTPSAESRCAFRPSGRREPPVKARQGHPQNNEIIPKSSSCGGCPKYCKWAKHTAWARARIPVFPCNILN